MAIVCKKCKYLMEKTQIIGYILSDAYDLAKTIAPIIAPALLLNYYGLKPENFGNLNINSSCINNNPKPPYEDPKLPYHEEPKRNLIENTVLMFFNKQKIICPSCLKYKGWINKEEDTI